VLQALTVPAAMGQVRLPEMGETVSASMPLGAERRLGDQIWDQIRADPAYLDDPVLGEYLQTFWQPLVKAARARGDMAEDVEQAFAWQSFLVRDRSINAFALPGGYVGLHLGLIAQTAYPDELVSVVAHELAHVTQRHIARGAESSGRQTMIGLAAMILGLLAASRSSNPDMAQAAIAGGQAAMIQGQLNFSRDMEREADRLGHRLMTDAGFQPEGMTSMFEKLDQAGRLNDAGNFPYLRSHPLTTERVAQAQARAGLGSERRLSTNPEYELMRARARVLMDPAAPALEVHLQALQHWPLAKTVPLELAYAAVLAAVVLRDEDQVLAALARMPALPASTALARWQRLLMAEALDAMPGLATRAAEAGPQLRSLLASGRPEGQASTWQRPELIWWGRALLRGTDTTQAQKDSLRETLRTRLVTQTADGLLWQLLADAETARGNRLGMMRASAEAQLAGGKPDLAMTTLVSARREATQRGTRQPADVVELAVIDARLGELRKRYMPREARGDQRGGAGQRGG
jgi:predicted Zn-dependent protease